MQTAKRHQRRSYRKYQAKTVRKSPFDDSPTLIVNEFHAPRSYEDAIQDVITAYRHDISFNKALDQVAALYAGKVNRNKLAEYALRTIANDY